MGAALRADGAACKARWSDLRLRARAAVLTLMCAASALGGCAVSPPAAPAVLIFGEQHDQPDQQRQVAGAVSSLAGAGRLGALVLEMADRGTTTATLASDADEAAVRAALRWNEAGWPWAQYGPVVMAAVQAGVRVDGGNLPRPAMREAMSDPRLDGTVTTAVRERLAQAIDEGHCGLLPAAMSGGMLRVQIARDRSMAAAVQDRLQRGRSVVLLTGAQHASRDRGVPLHLAGGGALDPQDVFTVMFSEAGGLLADERRVAVVTPQPDPCERLRPRPVR